MPISSNSINGVLIKSGTSAERATLAANIAGKGTEFWESDTGDKYRSNGTSWRQFEASGAMLVTDGISGVARNRFISATTGTLPTLAGSGTATWASPGVRGVVIDSVRCHR